MRNTRGYVGFLSRDERFHVQAMVNRFKYDFRYIHVFVILFKQNDNRLTSALWDMLKMFESMFGPDFWNNVILGATHWHYSNRMVRVNLLYKYNVIVLFGDIQ